MEIKRGASPEERLAEAERRIEEARRTGAESLDLGDLELRELPASLVDLKHLRHLYLGSSGLRAQRKFLWRGYGPVFADLAALAGLQCLQSLHLNACFGVADLAPLAKLKELQKLDLWGTRVTDLTPLAKLQKLENLNLPSTGVTDLAPLADLQGLKVLILSNTGVTDLAPLAKLQGLQTLNLRDARVTNVAPLARLRGLKYLDLGNTGVTEVAPLAKLRGLKNLDLWNTGVIDLMPLANLQGLQILSLHSTGVKDLAPLAKLKGLKDLDLGSTSVTDLAPLANLQELQRLYLSKTEVTDLAPLANLKGLQNLYLMNTGVTDLTPLANLQGLLHLNIYGCRPGHVTCPGLADLPSLTELITDEITGVPREILSQHQSDNCLPRLRTYFSEVRLGAETENEIKVVLLGNGRVGKTQLCRRFRAEPFDGSIQSTHGVQIWREELRVQAGGQEQAFQVNWWDFGGQDIYHGTHALFLRSRAVFLILWTPTLENQNEYDENGLKLRNQPLAYWLDYVRSLAGKGSPVIVVQSQCDRFADERPGPQRPEGLGFFKSCAYSAIGEQHGREALEAHLRDAIRYLLERNGALEIGHGRAEVRRQLYEWRSKDQKRKPEKRRHRTLTLKDFRALCDKVGGIVSWEHALDYLHQTGVVFHRPDLFSDRIVLDQDWALDAIYTVFHRGRAVPLLRDSGRFTREDLAVITWQEHSREEQLLFLGLMESCGVCFPCGKTPQGETLYVAPDLLPKFEAIRLPAWKEDAPTTTLRLEYRFFHQAVIRDLMSAVARRAEDLAEYWKYGVWLKDGQRDTQLLVQFVDTSTSEVPGAGALELKAQGRDPLGLLREIRKSILRQRIGEEPEELLTLDGTTVARSALEHVTGGQVNDIDGKPVPAAAFTAFFQDRKPEEKSTDLQIAPQAPTHEEKGRREIFLSYAWGDDTPKGKVRGEIVDRLYTALTDDRFSVIRDRDHMRPGDRISSFIRQLTRADRVVAVISDKYLRSPYCMSEIHGLWQRSQQDADLLAECLVPVVLPEVKIEGLRGRAVYVRYWKAQKKELEALFRELGPDLDDGSLRELRQVRAFAQDMDGILRFLQDVLMSRKLEAHLDDGFQAVRDALRRRIETSAER